MLDNSKHSAPAWDSFGRANASATFRQQSAAMGKKVTQAIVDEAQVSSGMKVLDVACGTGEPSISIATLLNGTGEVTGIDISPGPLKIASERAGERSLPNVRFERADVHDLPFPNSTFDRVTCRLGIMFFADLPNALRQLHRVLKPGGRVSLLAWGPMEQPYFETTIGTILRVVPDLRVPDSAASMFKFGQPGALSDALRDAGFQRLSERLEKIPWNWPGTPEELWDYFREVTIPFKPLFEAVPDNLRPQVNREVLAAIGSRYDGQQVRYDAAFVLASAAK